MTSRRALFPVGVLLLALNGAASASTAQLPDLTGAWQLVPAESEDPRERLREMPMGERGTDPSARHGAATRHEGRTPGEARSGERRTAGERRATGLDSSATFERLEISHREPLLEVTYGDGRRRRLYTDGRDLGGDGRSSMREGSGHWADGAFLLVRQTERGEITETWELSEERLRITTAYPGGERRPAMSFVRTYERQEADEEPEP